VIVFRSPVPREAGVHAGPVNGFAVAVADLRAAATAFARLRDRAWSATGGASAALAGTAGMAGDDAALGRWRARYDPTAEALWAPSGLPC
jgi:hypothetical protein